MSIETQTAVETAAAGADSGWLEVGHGHRIWYERSGACDGRPAVLLHGGPGSASTPRQREIFDAARWNVVQFDQRGCGRSAPLGETAHNHTDASIDDIETLRRHLGIERWFVCGGSWGAALALAYAARHRARVDGVLLRGTFLTGRADLDWFFHGVGAFAPQANADFLAAIPRSWRRSVVSWLDRCFAGGDAERQRRVAAAWQTYEIRLENAQAAVIAADSLGEDAARRLVAKYRVQAHYLARRCFLGESAVLRAASALGGVPVALVHGSNDRICVPRNAWRVQRACAGSRLAWAAAAGHDPFHPAAFRLLRAATDAFAAERGFAAWPASAPPR
ncbi:MAG TPA: alpha/beta fold hydrolase [Dokdonella sp.]